MRGEWRKLEDRFHNGKEFQYTLADVTRGDHSDPLLPTTTTSTYMEFHNVGLEEYSISITSENSVGQVKQSMLKEFSHHHKIPDNLLLLYY